MSHIPNAIATCYMKLWRMAYDPITSRRLKMGFRKIFSHYFLKRISQNQGMCKKASAPTIARRSDSNLMTGLALVAGWRCKWFLWVWRLRHLPIFKRLIEQTDLNPKQGNFLAHTTHIERPRIRMRPALWRLNELENRTASNGSWAFAVSNV